ncbi:MAG: lamin tail domain-containing protein [Ignavibacteria bacterium]|nr:lamin tail domain-containing protein [Ignavibacteria bacterium]
MKTFLKALAGALILSFRLSASPVINEVMYTPADPGNEWFELLNTGETIDLSGWKWKDATSALRTISSQPVALQRDSFIVICQDSLKFRAQYPESGCRLIQTAWSALNNTGDNLILINTSGARVDSLSFATSWGGTSAYSLERKYPLGLTNSSVNWGSCIFAGKASPGAENSIRAKEHDVAFRKIQLSPTGPVAGSYADVKITLANTGLNPAEGVLLKVYDDRNLDTASQPGELIVSSELNTIQPGDSAGFELQLTGLEAGRKQLIAIAEYAPDNDTSDNIKVHSFYVSEPGAAGSMVINEIMYDPLTGMSEWIELYNPSPSEYDVKGWKIIDNTSELDLSDSSLTVPPGAYLVIASDSSLLSQFAYLTERSPSSQTIIAGSLSLSNSGERITLADSLLTTIDQMNYNPSMHNPDIEDPTGISLERINPALPSAGPSNWSSCTYGAGGTPGKKNSLFADYRPGSAEISIEPNPFSPDGDGFQDAAVITCRFDFSSGTLRAGVYDVRGNLVSTLANNEVTGSIKDFIFSGYSDGKTRLPVGIYVVVIEAIDRDKGMPVTVKAPVVIAARM